MADLSLMFACYVFLLNALKVHLQVRIHSAILHRDSTVSDAFIHAANDINRLQNSLAEMYCVISRVNEPCLILEPHRDHRYHRDIN